MKSLPSETKYQEGEALRFLVRASEILGASLDYEKTLQSLARLVVPMLADWCIVYVLQEDKSTIERVGVAHKDPAGEKLLVEWKNSYPLTIAHPHPAVKVLKSGKAKIIRHVPYRYIRTMAHDRRHLTILKALGIASTMIIPLITRGHTLGVIRFVRAQKELAYQQEDFILAQELSRRAAIAVDNARLYHAAQEEIAQRKKAEKRKDEFLSIASHELKTPVTSLKAFTQILRQRFAKSRQKEALYYLARMEAQLEKLTMLISDLLDVSKIAAGKLVFHMERFEPNRLIDEIIEDFRNMAPRFQFVKKGFLQQQLFGDRDRIEQVLINLLSNAVKYSPTRKKIIIHVEGTPEKVLVSVQDFGIGIAHSYRKRIFERFARGDSETSKAFAGLGIGLYISSEIVKRHGGKIWVESEPGKGATFSFTIPFRQKNMEQAS